MKNKRKRWYLLWFVGSADMDDEFFDSFGKYGLDFLGEHATFNRNTLLCCRHCWVYFI